MTRVEIRSGKTLARRMSPILAGLFLIGCGGSGGPAGGTSGAQQSAKVGMASITFTGHPNGNIAQNTGGVSVVGQAGASYSSLSINPTPSLAGTSIAFTRQMQAGSGPDQLFTMPALGGAAVPLMHTTVNGYPSYTNSGIICFATYASGGLAIGTVKEDGSGMKIVAGNTTAIPSINPAGTTIAYIDTNGNIWTMPSGGGTPTKIYSLGNAVTGLPVWNSSGTLIAFGAVTSGVTSVYTMTATGGSLTNVSSSFTTGTMTPWSWSPDGNYIACSYGNPVTSTNQIEMIPVNGGYPVMLTPSGFSDPICVFSPDNQKLAFYRTNVGGAIPGIYTADFSGSNQSLVLEDPTVGSTGPVQTMAWSPFQENQSFVGTHGTLLGTPVSGFLLSQVGNVFGSLLTFTTTTSSTATITTQATTETGAPMVFTLKGDSITNISYANVYNGTHYSIPLTSTPSTIVTVDGVTGLVDLVVPAVMGKAQPAIAKSSGKVMTLSGQFPAIYDGKGKNLAPNGASSIQIDRSTGHLIGFR